MPDGRMASEDFQRHIGASESDIQKTITDYLTLLRIPFSVTDASRAFGHDGQPRKSKVAKDWPDVTGVLPPDGRMLAIECKTRKGKLSKGQKEMLEKLEAAGALVIVPRCFEDVEQALKASGAI